MQTNKILNKITVALSLDVPTMKEIYTLVSYPIEEQRIGEILLASEEQGVELCSYEELGVFLDGLILLKRGPNPTAQKSVERPLTNNLILKKIRIALNLKEMETEIIFGLADIELTKQQLASLFRKESHKNFTECSDELLLAFLDGLDEFCYTGEDCDSTK